MRREEAIRTAKSLDWSHNTLHAKLFLPDGEIRTPSVRYASVGSTLGTTTFWKRSCPEVNSRVPGDFVIQLNLAVPDLDHVHDIKYQKLF